MQIAIVGCGAAGMYTARKLLERLTKIKIALFETDLLPFGLVRTGIAPDHPELRALRSKFAETIRDSRVQYFGSGNSFNWSDAGLYFNGIIDARGCSKPNRLELLNYECKNVIDSQNFVEWVLGLKKAVNINGAILSARRISIIGLGNVSLDVARFLLSTPRDCTNLEVGDDAIRFLFEKKLTKVQIFGRKSSHKVLFVLLI